MIVNFLIYDKRQLSKRNQSDKGFLVICSDSNQKQDPEKQKRLILVGGFLGAGKTTIIGKLVRYLQSNNLLCGVITNDQAAGLVDTRLANTLDGAKISEIAGGCFCCKLDQLAEMLDGQWAESAPDVIVAEPVGSCTDLMATVLLPLRKAYRQAVVVSPLSVILDGRRALASLGGRRTPGVFSKDVGYIYRKQIEEAEILVVNKMDLLPEEDLGDLLARLEREYPGKETFVLSAKSGVGLEAWAERILQEQASPKELMEVDYIRYGVGEALLGWCNAEIELTTASPREGDGFLIKLASEISTGLSARKMEVAHFKMSLADEEGCLGVINQVMSGVEAEISVPFPGDFQKATLTVNIRAEGDPGQLREMVDHVIRQQGDLTALIREMDAFQPGQPVPVERVVTI